MTLTFAIRVIYRSRPTSHLNSSVLASSTAEIKAFLVLKDMVTLTMTFVSSVIYLSYCRVISFFGTKGHGDLDL